MSTLKTQIHGYFAFVDKQQGAVDIATLWERRIGEEPVQPLRSTKPLPHRPRRWLIGVAAAVVVLLLVGGVAVLVQLVGDIEPSPVVTTPLVPETTAVTPQTTAPPTPTTVPATTPVTSDGSSVADPVSAPELVWTRSDFTPGSVSALVSDGDQFFIIGPRIHSSVDGLTWESRDVENMPAVESLDGTWLTDTDAASDKILHLVLRDNQATTFLFDMTAGEVHMSVLPFPAGTAEDLRGFVALNRDGESVAFLYDLIEDISSPMPTAAFHSADGVEWAPIPGGQLPDGVILSTAALGDGFVASIAEGQLATGTFWHSSDGVQWETAEVAGALPVSLVSWGESAVAYSESAFGPQAISANPAYVLTAAGGSELNVDLTPLEGGGTYGPLVAAGGIGIVAIAPIGDGSTETWFVEYSPDGISWVRQALPFSGINPFEVGLAATTDRVVVRANGDLWVGNRP